MSSYNVSQFLLYSVVAIISVSNSEIIRVKLEDSKNEVFSTHCELFGYPKLESPKGYLVKSSPPDACTNMSATHLTSFNSTVLSDWILLVEEGMCNITVKVLNAQLANYSAVIIIEGEMDFDNIEEIIQSRHEKDICKSESSENRSCSDFKIMSCIVNEKEGAILKGKYTFSESMRYIVEFEEDSPHYSNSNYLFLAVFGTTICMSVVWLLLYCAFRLINNGYIWLREMITGIPYESLAGRTLEPQHLPKWVLKKLPVKIWSETDPKDICAICIEDILPFHKVRFLPCSHGFHITCIDKWLLNSSRNCPICKRKIIYLKKVLTSWNSEQEHLYFQNPGSHLLAPIAFNNDHYGSDSSLSFEYSISDSDSEEDFV